MRNIKILDCTLRDGGFVNDWNFGIGSIKSIICRLDNAGIDIIEIGFIDDRRQYDLNRSIFPDGNSVKPVFQSLEINHAMIVGMIDFGTCSLDRIPEKTDSPLDGIRVIFKKKDITEALSFCEKIKDKGYKIFIQPVSVTGYTDNDLLDLISRVNEIVPFGFSIVDTYGLLHKKELFHYYLLFDKNLNREIAIGYHAHNNFQLAYANAIELSNIASERTLVIDSSLYGMGKGAGNTNTELLAMYLNENSDAKYGINQLLEAIDVDIAKEYSKKYWGYSLLYYISALNDCHPDYVSTLINKKTLSVNSINEILSGIDSVKKLSYDKEFLEDKYLAYQNNCVDDSVSYAKLGEELRNKDILIIGPGKSIETHQDIISEHIKKNNAVVIAINFVSDAIDPDYVFMGNAKRYSQFFNKIYYNDSKIKVICTSNITEAKKEIDYRLNFIAISDKNDLIRDNPFLMLIRALININIKKVSVAGLDGYSTGNHNNYFGEYIQFLYCSDDVVLRNELISNAIKSLENSIDIEFITPSIYVS